MIAAVVPAAGESRRMGRPKLILPVGGRALIARVVTALRDGGASVVIVVAPPIDADGAAILHAEANDAGAVLLVPDRRPAEMRESFEHAIDHLSRGDREPSTILLAPADSPGLSAELVARVVDRARDEATSIVVPVFRGKRGHPVALPWKLAREVLELPAGMGVNALLKRHVDRVVALNVTDPTSVVDLNTPDDYERWLGSGDSSCR